MTFKELFQAKLSFTCAYAIFLGFHEDHQNNTFGIKKKGIYHPLSDFIFTFKMKVLSDKAVSTGYLVSVKQETFPETERYVVYF